MDKISGMVRKRSQKNIEKRIHFPYEQTSLIASDIFKKYKSRYENILLCGTKGHQQEIRTIQSKCIMGFFSTLKRKKVLKALIDDLHENSLHNISRYFVKDTFRIFAAHCEYAQDTLDDQKYMVYQVSGGEGCLSNRTVSVSSGDNSPTCKHMQQSPAMCLEPNQGSHQHDISPQHFNGSGYHPNCGTDYHENSLIQQICISEFSDSNSHNTQNQVFFYKDNSKSCPSSDIEIREPANFYNDKVFCRSPKGRGRLVPLLPQDMNATDFNYCHQSSRIPTEQSYQIFKRKPVQQPSKHSFQSHPASYMEDHEQRHVQQPSRQPYIQTYDKRVSDTQEKNNVIIEYVKDVEDVNSKGVENEAASTLGCGSPKDYFSSMTQELCIFGIHIFKMRECHVENKFLFSLLYSIDVLHLDWSRLNQVGADEVTGNVLHFERYLTTQIYKHLPKLKQKKAIDLLTEKTLDHGPVYNLVASLFGILIVVIKNYIDTDTLSLQDIFIYPNTEVLNLSKKTIFIVNECPTYLNIPNLLPKALWKNILESKMDAKMKVADIRELMDILGCVESVDVKTKKSILQHTIPLKISQLTSD
jgi:hypothetical protein